MQEPKGNKVKLQHFNRRGKIEDGDSPEKEGLLDNTFEKYMFDQMRDLEKDQSGGNIRKMLQLT